MAVTRIIRGRRVELTARQIKQRVRELTGWSSEEYSRRYDVFRNRTRNYERAFGLERGSIKANEAFYRIINKQVYAEERYGEEVGAEFGSYNPEADTGAIEYSQQELGILQSGASSTGRALTRAQLQAAKQRVVSDFSALISKSPSVNQKYAQFVAENPNATAAETREFLVQAANEMKELQRQEYEANRDFYDRYGLAPGSP